MRSGLAMATLYRLMQIMRVLIQHALSVYAAWLVCRIPYFRQRLPPSDMAGPERLKTILESLGGSFVKLGQMLALQPDILPDEYCKALYNLLDRVSPVPQQEIEEVFLEEIGKMPQDALDDFDGKPLASGSIGQVHIGHLDGRKVAVKVQRPDTLLGFHRDIRMMKAFAWLIRCSHFKLLYWMIPPFEEFAEWTVEELDFRMEARYMRQLRFHAQDCPRQYVPEVMHYATRRVLVIEFLEGVTLIDHMRRIADGDPQHADWLVRVKFDSHEFARNIIDNFLQGASEHGVFHADLHPANLMLLPNNVVGYMDFGITGVLSQFSRHNLLATTLAFARRDIDGLCTTFFAVSSMDKTSDPDGFRADMKRMSEKWYHGSEEDPTLTTSASTVFLEMLTLSRNHNIWPQRDIIKYIRSAMAIDGLIHQFAPEFDVGAFLATSSRKYLTKRARRALFSHDALINWSKATAELSRSGAFRFSSYLERIVNMQQSSSAGSRGNRDPSHRQSSLMIAMIACVVAALAFTTNESYAIGINLFTSQLIVVAAFVMASFKTSSAVTAGGT
jgi:ubiquinone biosynthesis protein